jgi:hypothetical protein
MRVARRFALALESRKRQLREFHCAAQVLGMAFVVDRELLASVEALFGIAGNFPPDLRGSRVLVASLGHHREQAPRLRAKCSRQPGIERKRACGKRTLGNSAAL